MLEFLHQVRLFFFLYSCCVNLSSLKTVAIIKWNYLRLSFTSNTPDASQLSSPEALALCRLHARTHTNTQGIVKWICMLASSLFTLPGAHSLSLSPRTHASAHDRCTKYLSCRSNLCHSVSSRKMSRKSRRENPTRTSEPLDGFNKWHFNPAMHPVTWSSISNAAIRQRTCCCYGRGLSNCMPWPAC